MSDLWFWLMSSPILRFCSSMRELFSNTSFFRHSFSWINDRSVHWVLRTVNEGSIDRSLQITCMILWMLCMIMAVSMDMFDKPNETLPCFCRSSIWKRKRDFSKGCSSVKWSYLQLSANYVPTFEDKWSSLSPTFPTANRISVLCCRASVIKKDVTSLDP